MTPEGKIQAAIINALRQIPVVSVWRSNVDHRRPNAKCGIAGQADITGIVKMMIHGKPYGIRVEIEVKTDEGKQSPAQKAFQQRVEDLGGIYVLARSVDDVIRELGMKGGM